MRQLFLALSFASTLLLTTAQGAAQDQPAANPAAASSEPGFLEKGGSLDQGFGTALEWFNFLPFYDLTRSKAPAYPWTDANGNEISEAAHEEFVKVYGKIRAGTVPNPHPTPWTDQAGAKIVLSPQGAPVQSKLPFVVVWLIIAAVFFTLAMRFVNLRMFRHAIKVVSGKYEEKGGAVEGEVTPFQALSSALSATVGLGNIGGVAIAIMVGGPGATVWMVFAGLLGMTLKFTECTLGQKYRTIDSEGRVLGGPMRYLAQGLEEKGYAKLGVVLSVMFAIFCIGGSLAGGNSFQVNQSLSIVREQIPFFKDNGWVFGVLMAAFVGFVIIGGIKRIAATASKIVPAMCLIYVAAALLVLVFHAGEIPTAFQKMITGAFTGEALYGGVIGTLITGFQRAAFSNEAGVGSASIAHSAAKTEYPVREGIVALLEPFIDTVVVCTITALVITITGVYADPTHAELVVSKEGAALTRAAFSSVDFLGMNVWFPYVLLLSLIHI